MLCDNEIADLMDIEITTSTVTGCFMFYKKCFNTWNTLYLGFPESKERGLSGSELGTLLTFSVPAPARGFRWNASSIFSTWINCPPSPRSAMNLKEKRAKVRVNPVFQKRYWNKNVVQLEQAMRTWEWHRCNPRCRCHCRVLAWSTGRSWNRTKGLKVQ